jgi:hypothetical protein
MAGKNPVVDDDMPAGAVSPDDETVNFGAGVDDNESLDLSGVNENQPMKLIPNGPYPATVVHAEWKKSNSGNKMYEVRFRMQDPDDGKNRTLFFHATATPDTMSRSRRTSTGISRSTLLRGRRSWLWTTRGTRVELASR